MTMNVLIGLFSNEDIPPTTTTGDERENHDLLGIVPRGHPDLRRLVLHDAFSDGYHPLRRDAPTTVPEGSAALP